jgi:Lipase (class 3)
MPTIRRIVFGEPKPGELQFAGFLSALDQSVSYCNRTGPLQHDRVTDVPYDVPVLGLNFVHPTPLQFVSAAPATNDAWGIFSLHHAALYAQGASALDPVTARCAWLCKGIYAYPGDAPVQWDARQDTAGVAWGVKFYDDKAFVVFRGSDTLFDWLRDLTGFDPAVNNHSTFGAMWAGFMIGMDEAWAAIGPLVAKSADVIFTGHSLGAARAGVASGFALQSAAATSV